MWFSRLPSLTARQYLTITLAQAAVFLIRITKAPVPIQAVVYLEPSVVVHYLKMSVDLLESADTSETRLSTYLAKTIRDISRGAGITGVAGIEYDDPSQPRPGPQATNTTAPQNVGGGVLTERIGETASFDMENLSEVENQLVLGHLLGLPGDDGAGQSGSGWNWGVNGYTGYTGEFGFAVGIRMGEGEGTM